MTPANIIRVAKSDWVVLALSPTGTLKANGDDKAVRRWLGVIREHKGQLIDALQVGAGDTALETDRSIAYRAWLIHYADRDPVQRYCAPPATHAEILASHPDAIAAEPGREPPAPGAGRLKADRSTAPRRAAAVNGGLLIWPFSPIRPGASCGSQGWRAAPALADPSGEARAQLPEAAYS